MTITTVQIKPKDNQPETNWYKQGVWYNDKKNQIALVYTNKEGVIIIDKNKHKLHPIFRGVKCHVVEKLTGEYFFNKALKNYEHISEVDFETAT